MKKLILLTYVNRSGSTYLAQLLSTDSSIFVCPEGEALVPLLLENPAGKPSMGHSTLLDLFRQDTKLRHWGVDLERLREPGQYGSNFDLFWHILDLFRAQQAPEVERVLFKAERILYLAEKLARQAGKDRLVIFSLLRDARAVYGSQKHTNIPETGRPMSTDVVKTALFWRDFVRESNRLRAAGVLVQVKFENLIGDTPGFFGFLNREGLGPLSVKQPSYGNLFQRLPEAHRMIHANITSGPQQQRIDAWKQDLTASECRIIDYLCRRELAQLDYPVRYTGLSIIIGLRIHWRAWIIRLKEVWHQLVFKIR